MSQLNRISKVNLLLSTSSHKPDLGGSHCPRRDKRAVSPEIAFPASSLFSRWFYMQKTRGISQCVFYEVRQ